MKIAIDARWIFPEIFGIGAYARELITQLARIDTANSYLLLFDNAAMRDRITKEAGLAAGGNFSTEVLPWGVFSIRSQVLLPRLLSSRNVEVFHSPNYMIPLAAFPRSGRGKIKCVTTIHDVIPMIFPDHAPRSRKARIYPVYRRLMVEVGARSNVIIADSHASRTDVMKHLRIPEPEADKVLAIYCGVSERFHPPASKRTAKQTKTILYAGRIDPYKNVTALIKGFAAIRHKFNNTLSLTIAGSKDPRYPEAPRLVEELGIGGCVKWTGYVSDDELVSIYQNADLLVHPSRYEGFGLQVVEAMACGTPVVCGNGGSLPEVAGDAAITVDPDDVEGFAAAMLRVLSDDALASEMSRKGIKQAAHFTWKRTAEETLAAYATAARS